MKLNETELLELIAHKIPTLEEALMWVTVNECSLDLDGETKTFKIEGEALLADVTEMKDKIVSSVYIGDIEYETYHEDTAMSWFKIYGDLNYA